uniref:transposase n=1 Tax=Kyrpidia spormannii TaxID=2055160 RepID=UPI00105648CE
MKGWTSACGTYSKRPGRPVSWNATKGYRLTERNVLERLPEKPRDWVKRQLQGTWRQETAKESPAAPRRLAAQLEKAYPGTAASLREGMEETVTVIRLGIPELLQGNCARRTRLHRHMKRCVWRVGT